MKLYIYYLLIIIAILASGFAIAYFGVFRDSVRTIDNCSAPLRHYYIAPVIFPDRFFPGDYRNPNYNPDDPSNPLLVWCLCQNKDKAGYEKLTHQTTTDETFGQACKIPPPYPGIREF